MRGPAKSSRGYQDIALNEPVRIQPLRGIGGYLPGGMQQAQDTNPGFVCCAEHRRDTQMRGMFSPRGRNPRPAKEHGLDHDGLGIPMLRQFSERQLRKCFVKCDRHVAGYLRQPARVQQRFFHKCYAEIL